MPANVGQMFYYGEVPWHGGGKHVGSPLTIQQALEHGGLNWDVSEVDLQTEENPPTPATQQVHAGTARSCSLESSPPILVGHSAAPAGHNSPRRHPNAQTHEQDRQRALHRR